VNAVLAHADDGQVETLTRPSGHRHRAPGSERRDDDRRQSTAVLTLVVAVPAISRTDSHVDGRRRTA